MFCSNCGAPLKDNVSFCPACGHSIKQRRPIWKKALIGLGLLALALFLLSYFYKEDLEDTVEGQLKAIKANKLTEAYYGYTSKDFQQTNSFEKFKEFIRSFPLLQTFQKINIGHPNIQDDTADVKVVIESQSDADGEVDYKLIKEDDKWKVLGMQLTEFQKVGNAEQATATAALIAPIEKQMKALKDNDLLAAYKEITAKEFQQQTPFENFKSFLLKYPILTQQQHYDFKEHYTDEDKGVVTIVLNPEQEAIPVRYNLIKEDGKWKILLMRIGDSTKNTQEATGMISVVQEQLEFLKQNKIEQAYSLISKELQKETPLENFHKFILNYPAFTNHNLVNINEPYVENGVGRLTVELKNDQGNSVVEYALGKEEGVWKILGLHVEKSPETPNVVQEGDIKNFKTRDLIAVIQSFLSAIRDLNLKKAYSYTSIQFQEENPFNAFEEFIKKHPEFVKSTTSSFEKLIFNNNIATFNGEIIHSDNVSLPVEFDLINEDGKWKILHIYVLPAVDKNKKVESLPEGGSTVEFSKFVIGTKVNDQGIIENQTNLLKQDSGDIYVNLYILQGAPGEHVELQLKHVESGSSIPVVQATLTDKGDSVLTFAFSPPPQGWPKGNYQLRASSSNNKTFKTYSFRVD